MLYILKFFSPTNALFIKHLVGLIKSAFVGEKNFNIIKMHGTTIKMLYILSLQQILTKNPNIQSYFYLILAYTYNSDFCKFDDLRFLKKRHF
jgi:hypothetical protein